MSSKKRRHPSPRSRIAVAPSRGGAPATSWRYAVVFVAALGVQLLLVLLAFQADLDRPLNRATALVTARTLALLGVGGRAEGDVVISPTLGSLRVIFECTAAFPVIIFVAAVLAYPCGWRWKLAGVVTGVPAILAVNVLRLMTLLYVAHAYPTAMEWVHLVAWQALFVVIVVLMWSLWASRVPRFQGRRRA